MITIFHPEMQETPNKYADLIITTLHKRYKVQCLKGIELRAGKSVFFQYRTEKGSVYYVTEIALNKLEKKYNIAFKSLLS